MTTYRPLKPLILNEDEIKRVAPPLGEIVAIVENTYRLDAAGMAEVPTKIGVHPARPNSLVHAMPAWVSATPALGVKLVTYFPGNFASGVHDSTAIIVLYDAENGQPTAIMEGMWITFARTVACAAVAAKHLAPPAPRRLGLVGCGGLGEWSLRIFTELFPTLEEVWVTARRAETRDAFCARHAGKGNWSVRPAPDARAAVEGMDIVVSSTPQQSEPRLFAEWWSPGTLVLPLDYPYSWDDAAYVQADAIFADNLGTLARYEETSRTSGKRPNFRLPVPPRTIQDLVTGRTPGRRAAMDRIMAIVTGIASTDVTVATEIYRRARAARLGVEIALN